jgi:hypothetical protein
MLVNVMEEKRKQFRDFGHDDTKIISFPTRCERTSIIILIRSIILTRRTALTINSVTVCNIHQNRKWQKLAPLSYGAFHVYCQL